MDSLSLILSAILVILSGLFSGLNLGLMSLDPYRLKRLIQLGNKNAAKIYPLRKNGNLLLTTVLLGNVIVNATLAIFLNSFTTGLIAIILSTGLIVMFGEIMPQAIFAKHALRLGAKTAWLVWLFLVVLYPVAKPISWVLDKTIGKDIPRAVTKKEFGLLAEEQTLAKGTDLERDDIEIIKKGLLYSEKTVREIMTPISKVYLINKKELITKEKISEIHAKGKSRVPVYDYENRKIIGILYSKDLINLEFQNPLTAHRLMRRVKEVVLETDKLDKVLEKFRKKRIHLFIVKNKEHEVTGIITLEDVIEEIIGEVYDEYDKKQ